MQIYFSHLFEKQKPPVGQMKAVINSMYVSIYRLIRFLIGMRKYILPNIINAYKISKKFKC